MNKDDSKNTFSVIIPVFNVEKYLDECVKSVLNQSFQDFEIILVDDGSKDNSGQLCDKFATEDNRIQVIHKENGGQLSARSIALKVATGYYICFLDADDVWVPDCLESIKNAIDKTQCDVIAYRWQKIDQDGRDLNEKSPSVFEKSMIVPKVLFFKKIIETSVLNSLCLKCCKRELYDIESDYSQFAKMRMGEDLFQSLPVIYNAKTFYFLDKVLYKYRINYTSVTHVYQQRQYQTLDIVRPLVYKYMEMLNLDTDENINLFYNMYLALIWNNIDLLFAGIKEKENRFAALKEIHNYDFVMRAEKYLNSADLDKVSRIGLKLFYKKDSKWASGLLSAYLSGIHFVRRIRR